jgi:hypothetical protein
MPLITRFSIRGCCVVICDAQFVWIAKSNTEALKYDEIDIFWPFPMSQKRGA